MVAKKSSLGKGLDALLSSLERPLEVGSKPTERLCHLLLDVIQPSRYQPRREFASEQLNELADSIRAQGVIQPIVVREIGQERYELVAGERRWRAAQLANLATIPAIVRTLSEQVAAAVALVENIQREDLNPIDEAHGLQRLTQEFNLTHQEVAEIVGRSRVAVTNQLRLLQLPTEVQRLVSEGKLQMGHARALLGLPVEKQLPAARQVVEKALSVRATEQLVQRWQRVPRQANLPSEDPHIGVLEEGLAQWLAAKVTIRHQQQGKGRLEIYYHSLEELEGILEKIGVEV